VLHRDRVLTKDDLLQGVWGGRIVSESALTTRINAVRRALGDDGTAQRLVRTFTRKGVRFVGEVTELRGQAPATGDPDGWAPPAIDKPSIAVLPFQNMSADPEQEFFADGIAEDVTTALARYPSLFVIARNSSFTYKGRTVDVKEIGRELAVRYVLEGSLRKSGNRVRVTAQLVEAETGRHVWADRCDRDLADIFAVQDEIAQAVTIAIAPAIDQAEQRRAMRKPPASLDAWAAYQRGLWHLSSATAAGNALAEQFLQQAIDLDPNFAGGHSALAQGRMGSMTQTPASGTN
jgi:TolB-like protein